MDDKPNLKELARFFPVACALSAGETYHWCRCGNTATQPFCDKDHCGEQSLAFVAPLTETACLCVCKGTANPPYCDGSHGALPLQYLKQQKT